MQLLLFPNTLFKTRYFPKDIKKIILLEDPIFYGYRSNSIYKFNKKKKIVLHKSSLLYYQNYLKKKGYKITYYPFEYLLDKKTYFFLENNKSSTYISYHIYDYELKKKLNKLNKLNSILTYIENPNFLLTEKDLQTLNNKNNKNNKNKYYHDSFYSFSKNKLGLSYLKSYDTLNRNKFIPTGTGKERPNKIIPLKKTTILHESIKFTNTHFETNYGNTNNIWIPYTHKDAKRWLTLFLENHLEYFGTYQDSIHTKEPYLFHSLLSPLLNIGLLNPDYILKKTNMYYLKNKKKIKINNYEGFIRQIIGWREYQRYIYMYAYKDIVTNNYFNHTNKITKHWYNATTGIQPLDDAIRIGFDTGYLHHILRLMIIANLMNLHKIHPDDCYRWFMEFSVDSYDWVMIQNVYSMGLWVDNGLTMRKPYISSSNYILSISNYKVSSPWVEIWKCLFYYFLYKNRKLLDKTVYKRNIYYFMKNLKKKNKKE